MSEQSRARGLERFLNLFTEVRPGEGATALLLALNVFLILMAYYVLKPVREALILGEGSAELKSYLSAGQVVLLAFVVPFYGRMVARFARMRLINVVTLFFVACPVVFYVLAQFGAPLAVVFFVWIGIFSLMIIAQFWSFANDVYTKEEGERLFVIVGFGTSLGAVAGARIADRLIEPVGVYQLMLLGAAILLGQLWLTNYVNRPERDRRPRLPTRPDPWQALGRERLCDGPSHALSAAHGADADARELGEHHRRVRPRQHRQGHSGGADCGGPGGWPDRGAAHRRLLFQVLHVREHHRAAAAAVRGVARGQAPRGVAGGDDSPVHLPRVAAARVRRDQRPAGRHLARLAWRVGRYYNHLAAGEAPPIHEAPVRPPAAAAASAGA